jgi:crotonobetainyl-CoA:carnitine CoA-transferase CaiB-like acyl-CoA transferase
MRSALDTIKILEIGHYVAGPYSGKLFADLGADVVKVERPDGGDPARRIGPFAPQG